MKLTTLIAQQPYDLNLLVRAMDGEVRPQYTKITQSSSFSTDHILIYSVDEGDSV